LLAKALHHCYSHYCSHSLPTAATTIMVMEEAATPHPKKKKRKEW